MKVKINKYAEGGPFFRATFIPASFAQGPSGPITGSSTSKNEEEDGLVDSDIYKRLLQDGGLTSDVYKLMSEMSAYNTSNIMSTGNTNNVLHLIGKVNEIINNKKMWESATQEAIKNGSYEEVAISNSGQLFYKNEEGGIGTTSADAYKKNPRRYGQLMSVADLLQERQQNVKLAYDVNIFNVAKNSVGLDNVKKDILDMFETLSSYSDLKEGTYSKEDIKQRLLLEQDLINRAGRKPNAQEQQGLDKLTQLLSTPGDHVKYEEKESGKGRDINAAYNYILGTLNDKEKRKLEVTAMLNGTSGTDIVKGMLFNYTTRSYESKMSPVKESQVTDTPEEGTVRSLTTYQLFHKDKLKSPDMAFTFNDPKMETLFRGAMGAVGPVITPNGESIPMTTLGNVLNTGLNQLLRIDQVYFGETKVSSENMNNIIYDGLDAAKVYMPVGRDGSPDYNSFADFKELYATYEVNKDNWSSKQASDFFNKNGFKIQIEEKYEDGKRIKVIKDNQFVKPFYLMWGYTNDATNLLDDNERFTTKLSKEEKRNIVPRLEQAWIIGTGKSAVNITPNKWGREDYYKGMIAIPYREGHAAIADSQVGQGPRERVSSIEDVQRNLRHSIQVPTGTSSSMVLKNN